VPSDDDIIAFPVTGGGNSPESQNEKNVGELKRSFDAAVEPNNPLVHEEAVVLALKYPGDLTIEQIASIYSYLKAGDGSTGGWGYVRDPRGLDYFNYANASLKLGDRANLVGGGDCDDFAILMAALIESIGGTTRIILARNNSTGGHAYSEVFLGQISAQDNQVDGIIEWLREKYDAERIYTHIDSDTKDVWLNLDWGPDEMGNAHPGGPFYQGDKHIVLCIRDKFIKTPLKLPEKSNRLPKMISLTTDKSSPQDAGGAVTLTVEALDPDNDSLTYRFYLNNEPVTRWIGENKWTWQSSDYDIGYNQIEARVRDGKHAGPDSFDSNKTISFSVKMPNGRPADIISINEIKSNKLEHDGPVYSVSFSPDGSKLATGSCDNSACIWDVRTSMELQKLTHDACVRSVSFSPDGSRLATGGDDGTAHIWDAASGKELQRLADGDMIVSVSFSFDGSKLATAAFNNFVCIWDAQSGAMLKKLTYDNTIIGSVSFNSDGSKLAICSSEGITVVDVSSGVELYRLVDNAYRSLQFASFSPDGRSLAAAGHDKSYKSVIIVWDVASKRVLQRLHFNGGILENPISYSPDGSQIAGGSDDGIVHIWDAASGQEIQEFVQEGSVTSVDFSPDGSKLVSGSYEKDGDGMALNDYGAAYIWDLGMKQSPADDSSYEVIFTDPNLEAAIRESIGRPDGTIYASDLKELTRLEAKEKSIADITGLEYCSNLEYLNLISNHITDLSPLSKLTRLKTLYLDDNQIADISPLAGLTSLNDLSIFINKVSDVYAFAGLINLKKLNLRYNRISDVSPLSGLTNLEFLYMENNPITDISPLSGLLKLKVMLK
jgi:WD40 repeat protein